MLVYLDLSEGESPPVKAEVLAVLFLQGMRLYAVIASVGGAPWYGLIHEHSDALISIEEEH